ncbi:MAG: NBR1-Ig-like domain-containing protein [Anaerolineales bacterium]
MLLVVLLSTLGGLTGCGAPPPTYLPPTSAPTATSTLTPTPLPPTPSPSPPPPATPSPPPRATPLPPCTADLDFLGDLTIPDGTLISPGSPLDKQWLVQNSGTCNWDSGYRLRLVFGDPLGATPEQALYPARAGSQAVIRILFTAPFTPGTYRSGWQAFTPDGSPFGEPIFIEIVVAP